METASEPSRVFRFGVYEVDLVRRELRKHGVKIKLQEQPFQILEMLLESSGAIVSREQVREKLWPKDTFVDFDHSLNTAINRLREALGDTADNPRFIETLPRRGYRFVAQVEGPPKGAWQPKTEEVLRAPAPHVKRTRVWVWPLAIATTVLALGVVFATQFWPQKSIDSVAVLPFVNAGSDPDLEYLSDGIAETLINKLAQIPGLKVMSRTSSFRYKGHNPEPRDVGKTLGVRAVLMGTVRQQKDELRVSVELVDVHDSRQIWGEEYSSKVGDLLALQTEIASKTSEKLRLKLSATERSKLQVKSTGSSEAYELYLRGQYELNKRTIEGFRNGLVFFQQAVDKDPGYALAYVGMADAYGLLKFYGGLSPKEATPLEKTALSKALELDDSLAEAHIVAGYLEGDPWGNSSMAERQFQRAIALSPNSVTAHHGYTLLLSALGRHKEAIEENRIEKALDPLSPLAFGNSAFVHYYAREYGQAEADIRKVFELEPRFPPAHLSLALIYEAEKKYPQAIQESQQALEFSNNSRLMRMMLGHAYAVAGQKHEAEEILRNILYLRTAKQYVSAYQIAALYAGLKQRQTAMDWLDKAYEEDDPWLTLLKVDPHFDEMRSDERFQAIVTRLQFWK